MSAVAMFPANLLLQAITLSPEGQVLSGYVVNGDWFYRSNGTHQFAYREGSSDRLAPVTVMPIKETQRLVFVPPSKCQGWSYYNSALVWAEKQPPFEGSLQEQLDMAELEVINMKGKPNSGFDDMDDDIPF